MSGSICIIGSGFSAASLALHLVSDGLPGTNLTIVGAGRLGSGQAYGCVADDFRLNVRADLQRIWPDDPNHFVRWAAARLENDHDAVTDVGTFYRRHDFADYVEQELEACPGMASVTHRQATATSVTAKADGWYVELDEPAGIEAQKIILATGNPAPDWPFPNPPQDSPTLIRSPWKGDWPSDIAADSDILVIGGGLTALDALHILHRRGHAGRITLVTPEGMLPPVQTDWQDAPSLDWPDHLRGSGFLRFMRQSVKDGDWSQNRMAAPLRGPANQHIDRVAATAASRSAKIAEARWLALVAGPLPCRPAANRLGRGHADVGQLTIIADRVVGLSTAPDGRHRADLSRGDVMTADAVINCSGAGRDRLVSRLIADGVIAAHSAMKQRPAVTGDLALLRADRTPHDRLFALALRRPMPMETSSGPPPFRVRRSCLPE